MIKKLKTWLLGSLFWLRNKPITFAFSWYCHLLSHLANMHIIKMDLILKMSNLHDMQIQLSLRRICYNDLIIDGKDYDTLYTIKIASLQKCPHKDEL